MLKEIRECSCFGPHLAASSTAILETTDITTTFILRYPNTFWVLQHEDFMISLSIGRYTSTAGILWLPTTTDRRSVVLSTQSGGSVRILPIRHHVPSYRERLFLTKLSYVDALFIS